MAIQNGGKTLLAIATACLLASCSGAPDEGDVRAAVEANFSQKNEAIVEMAGSSRAARMLDPFAVEEFKLLGCEESGETYRCDVTMSFATPLGSVKDRTMPVRLRQGDAGWVAVEGLQ